jgi:hypothetical protein
MTIFSRFDASCINNRRGISMAANHTFRFRRTVCMHMTQGERLAAREQAHYGQNFPVVWLR